MPSELIKITHWIFSGLLLIVYAIAFGKESVLGAVFFSPFVVSPILINILISRRASSTATQAVLLFTTIGYSCWAAYLYVDAMIIHVDPQSAILLLFTAIFAAPVLLLLWLACLGLERWHH